MATYTAIESLALGCAFTDPRVALEHARSALKVAIVVGRPDLAWRANELISTLGGK